MSTLRTSKELTHRSVCLISWSALDSHTPTDQSLWNKEVSFSKEGRHESAHCDLSNCYEVEELAKLMYVDRNQKRAAVEGWTVLSEKLQGRLSVLMDMSHTLRGLLATERNIKF